MAPDSISAPVHSSETTADREDAPDEGPRDARSAPVAQRESFEGTHACPLCGYTDDTRDSVFTHLQLSHRKRAISSALLEAHASAGAGAGAGAGAPGHE
ncbi:hypothetical protein [Halopiger aswanensis]|uniref:Uncharacterized protein n=1 Tax=Halopiger aswanensis TaxID=148449 RepID=A0A3R7KMY6_9EURY|nr:hypothetical protein [Halopiger aswanensis]RKD97581.1 hypothetical protein ATJ93_0570 [Halopiger aswanensis]